MITQDTINGAAMLYQEATEEAYACLTEANRSERCRAELTALGDAWARLAQTAATVMIQKEEQ
jgi:hypothetical protein